MSAHLHILQFGRVGQLGAELLRRAHSTNMQIEAYDQDVCDFTKSDSLHAMTDRVKVADVVVNACAYTAVDKAESECDLAFRINASAVEVLAELCALHRVPMIHVSTDYVYDGSGDTPRTECTPTAPLNNYGRSKLAGEDAMRRVLDAHLILRTSWVYSAHGSNFVKTMLKLGATREELRIINDQFGAPTSAAELARVILLLAEATTRLGAATPYGTYHFADAGETNWYEFAKEIFHQAGRWTKIPTHLIPIATSDYPTPATRPKNSRLDCHKIETAFGITRIRWQDALSPVIMELCANNTGEQP